MFNKLTLKFQFVFLAITTFFGLFLLSSTSNSFVDTSLPSLEGEYGKWKVFSVEQNNKKICYTVSNPIEMAGNHNSDRVPYIMVSIFGNNKQEVSISAGYIFRTYSTVSVSIDGIQERFVAENESLAWPEKNGSDKRIIKEMQEGYKIFVFSESYSGTYSVDTYSLAGFKKAIEKTKKLCGVKQTK